MEISPIALAMWCAYAFLFGIALGVAHDACRLLYIMCGRSCGSARFDAWYEKPLPIIHRPIRTRKKGKVWHVGIVALTIVGDILFFIVAALGTVLLQYEHNSGTFRVFALLCEIVGFFAYYFTIGKLVMMLSEGIVFCLKALFLIAFFIISYPFRRIFCFFNKKIKKFITNLQQALAKKRKKLYNKNIKIQLLREAEFGFLERKGRFRNAKKK